MKPSAAPARQGMQPLTPEEQKEKFIQIYMQKKAALAEGILYNLCRSCGELMVEGNHLELVKVADELSTEFMKVIYHQEVKINETEEKSETEEGEK